MLLSICPLLSVNEVLAFNSRILKYVSAVTVLLFSEKIKDDVHDEKKNISKRFRKWVDEKRRKAEMVLRDFGFDPEGVTRAFETQRVVERKGALDLIELTEPSARVMSEIYAFAAVINQTPDCEKPLREIGYPIGQIIYLLDSIVDYNYDLTKSNFNPLARCYPCQASNNTLIPKETKEKLFHMFETLKMNIENELKALAPNAYLVDILKNRLGKKLEEVLKTAGIPVRSNTLMIFERIKEITPLSLLATSKFAFASDGKEGGSSCIASLTFLILMVVAYLLICRGCLGRSCSSAPDKVTVDHGCGRKKTYKKDPCTGKYKDESCC